MAVGLFREGNNDAYVLRAAAIWAPSETFTAVLDADTLVLDACACAHVLDACTPVLVANEAIFCASNVKGLKRMPCLQCMP